MEPLLQTAVILAAAEADQKTKEKRLQAIYEKQKAPSATVAEQEKDTIKGKQWTADVAEKREKSAATAVTPGW